MLFIIFCLLFYFAYHFCFWLVEIWTLKAEAKQTRLANEARARRAYKTTLINQHQWEKAEKK